jgi:hypothetical protein
VGFAERQAESESGAVVRDIRVLPFIEVTFTPNSTLKPVGIHKDSPESDGTPKRKNPPEGGFFGGSRDFESFLWNLEWCRHQESNPGPTDYKSVALPTELYRRVRATIIAIEKVL